MVNKNGDVMLKALPCESGPKKASRFSMEVGKHRHVSRGGKSERAQCQRMLRFWSVAGRGKGRRKKSGDIQAQMDSLLWEENKIYNVLIFKTDQKVGVIPVI